MTFGHPTSRKAESAVSHPRPLEYEAVLLSGVDAEVLRIADKMYGDQSIYAPV